MSFRIENPKHIIFIGAGGIVRNAHLPAYAKAGFPILGVYDINRTKAQALAGDFSIGKVFSSLAEASDASSSHTVFDVAVPASQLLNVLPQIPDGSGVLMQKPMGENLQEAKKIFAICQEKNLTAAVNFQLRFAPKVIAARRMIESGEIGEITMMRFAVDVYTPWHLWDFLKKLEKPEILYHSIHYLDLIRSFLGEPKRVNAETYQSENAEGPEGSFISLDYGPDMRAQITTNHTNRFGPKYQASFVEWAGEKGSIRVRMGVNLNYPKGLSDKLEYCFLIQGQAPVWRECRVAGNWFPDAFKGSMGSLMNYLAGSGNLPTRTEDALKTMALVDACYQSSRKNSASVEIK